MTHFEEDDFVGIALTLDDLETHLVTEMLQFSHFSEERGSPHLDLKLYNLEKVPRFKKLWEELLKRPPFLEVFQKYRAMSEKVGLTLDTIGNLSQFFFRLFQVSNPKLPPNLRLFHYAKAAFLLQKLMDVKGQSAKVLLRKILGEAEEKLLRARDSEGYPSFLVLIIGQSGNPTIPSNYRPTEANLLFTAGVRALFDSGERQEDALSTVAEHLRRINPIIEGAKMSEMRAIDALLQMVLFRMHDYAGFGEGIGDRLVSMYTDYIRSSETRVGLRAIFGTLGADFLAFQKMKKETENTKKPLTEEQIKSWGLRHHRQFWIKAMECYSKVKDVKDDDLIPLSLGPPIRQMKAHAETDRSLRESAYQDGVLFFLQALILKKRIFIEGNLVPYMSKMFPNQEGEWLDSETQF